MNYVRYASNPYGNRPSVSGLAWLVISPVYSGGGDLEQFKVRITGLGPLVHDGTNPGCNQVPIPNKFFPETYDISHGLVLLSDGNNPFMTLGLPDSGLGLEALAEDGNPYILRNSMAEQAVNDYPTQATPNQARPRPTQEQSSPSDPPEKAYIVAADVLIAVLLDSHSGALENTVMIVTDTLIAAILATLLLQ